MTPFEREVLPHRKAALGLALKLTRNHADAEDLTQEALLRVWKAGRLEKGYLLKAVRNCFINAYLLKVPQGGSTKYKPRPTVVSLTGFESIREAREWYNRKERTG